MDAASPTSATTSGTRARAASDARSASSFFTFRPASAQVVPPACLPKKAATARPASPVQPKSTRT